MWLKISTLYIFFCNYSVTYKITNIFYCINCVEKEEIINKHFLTNFCEKMIKNGTQITLIKKIITKFICVYKSNQCYQCSIFHKKY